MPLSQALAIILPILILSDIVAVYKFRKQFDLDTVKLMTIGGGIGFSKIINCIIIIKIALHKALANIAARRLCRRIQYMKGNVVRNSCLYKHLAQLTSAKNPYFIFSGEYFVVHIL